MSENKKNEDLKKRITDLETELERSQRELCEGVRDWLDLKEAFKKVRREKADLHEAAVKAITASSGTTESHAKDMLDAWFKTVTNNDYEDKQ